MAEVQRASTELRTLGICHQRRVVNGLFTATLGTDDPLAAALHTQGRDALDAMPAELAGLLRSTVGLRTISPMGITELRCLAEDTDSTTSPAPGSQQEPVGAGSFPNLVDTIAAEGAGLVMTMGKGGVGKTTVAAAVAVAPAERGHRVHLTTTDSPPTSPRPLVAGRSRALTSAGSTRSRRPSHTPRRFWPPRVPTSTPGPLLC